MPLGNVQTIHLANVPWARSVSLLFALALYLTLYLTYQPLEIKKKSSIRRTRGCYRFWINLQGTRNIFINTSHNLRVYHTYYVRTCVLFIQYCTEWIICHGITICRLHVVMIPLCDSTLHKSVLAGRDVNLIGAALCKINCPQVPLGLCST